MASSYDNYSTSAWSSFDSTFMMSPLILSKSSTSSSKSSSNVTGFSLIGSGSALCSVIFATSLFRSGLVSILALGFGVTD